MLCITIYHSNAGGGGERVLWLAIKALAALHDEGLPLHIFIYSGDLGLTSEEIIKRAEVRRRAYLLWSPSFAHILGSSSP